jgi:tetratricopeptide (TPR) repeat protein
MKAVLLGIGSMWFSGSLLAQDIGACNLDLDNGGNGPYDYRTRQDKVRFVESYHFTRKVESLAGGQSGAIGGDISFILRYFPNHPRALFAASKLARREKTPRPSGLRYTPDCWFQRAIAFRPEDAQVRLVYGIELLKDGKRKAAIEQLGVAEELAGSNANVHYNLGLAYFDLGDYDKSLAYAHTAYKMGFPLPGLRDKLKKAGKWQD